MVADKLSGFDRKIEELFMKYLTRISFKWFEVGVLLGVPIHILQNVENIEQNRRIVEAIKVSPHKNVKVYVLAVIANC